jgi:hypothetical protein
MLRTLAFLKEFFLSDNLCSTHKRVQGIVFKFNEMPEQIKQRIPFWSFGTNSAENSYGFGGRFFGESRH